jgi:hypothetical protein
MKHLKTFESMADLAGDSYHRRQECIRTLKDMSLELSDENFIVEVYSEVLSRDNKYIIVNIQNGFRFNYNKIKDTLLSMISYMESEGYSIKSIQVSDKYVANLIPTNLMPSQVDLKGEELYLKYRPEQMVDYPIGQLIIIFKE